MAENSNIEWTDHTFNPWIGCTKVSTGCKHCYAETLMDKRYGRVEWEPPVGAYLDLRDRKGGDMSEWPEDLRIREFPTEVGHDERYQGR